MQVSILDHLLDAIMVELSQVGQRVLPRFFLDIIKLFESAMEFSGCEIGYIVSLLSVTIEYSKEPIRRGATESLAYE